MTTQSLFQRLPIVYKLSILLTALIVLCMSFLGSIIVYKQTRLLHDQINELGKSLVNHMSMSARDPLLTSNILSLEVLTASLAAGNSVVGSAIFSEKGEIITRAGLIPGVFETRYTHTSDTEAKSSQQKHPFPHEWFDQMHSDELFGMNVISFITPIRFKDITAGYALITFNQSNMDNAIRQSIKTIIAATLGTILFGFLLSFLLSRRLSQPIHHMTKAISNIDNGSFDFRFHNQRQDEIGQLMSSFNQMAEGMLKKAQVESALSRYLSPKVALQVTSNLESIELGGRRVEGSVLFADIVGFTKMSEKYPPEQIAALLNEYFSLLTKACEQNHGMVDKYMGDCAMMVFGVPEEDREHCLKAVTCSLLIKKLIAHKNTIRLQQNLPPVYLRIGLNTGTMLAGNMGSHERMEYTVVGDSVNLASRLCSVAEANQIIISLELYNRTEIKNNFIAHKHESIKLRGKEYPVSTYILENAQHVYEEVINKQFHDIVNQGYA